MEKSNIVEFTKNGKSSGQYAVNSVSMLHYMLMEKVICGTILYGNENQELSKELLKQHISEDCVDFDLFNYGDKLLINNTAISFSDLAKLQEIVRLPHLDDILENMTEENISYLVSEIEIRSNEHYFNGFIPIVVSLEELQNTDTYKSFMEHGNTGTLNISIYNNVIGDTETQIIPTKEQAQVLFDRMDEVEKIFEIETFGHTFHTVHEEEYANDYER